jgi:MFS family permease
MVSVNSLPVKITLLLISTLTVMAGATIAPSLPAMQAVFADIPNVGYLVWLVLTLPALFIAIGAPLVGVLIDQLGRKPMPLQVLRQMSLSVCHLV